jgi:heme-degrading monooxygenase HmoA
MLYARLQTVSVIQDPATAETAERRLIDIVSGHPGFAGLCLMEAVEDTAAGALLTLWRSEKDARLASERTEEARPGPRPVTLYSDRIYEVEGGFDGPDAAESPAAVVLIYFDGPHADEWLASARYAHERRIVPVMRQVPGVVGGFALWDPVKRDSVVVTLTVSLEAMARAQKAVNSTELLPGENAALLTGPDRAVVHHVSGYVGIPHNV